LTARYEVDAYCSQPHCIYCELIINIIPVWTARSQLFDGNIDIKAPALILKALRVGVNTTHEK